jgi:hypothetical protein
MKPSDKLFITVAALLAATAISTLALDRPSNQVLIEAKVVELDWAQMQAAGISDLGAPPADRAWTAFWRNRAGAVGSEVVAAQLAAKSGNTFELPLSVPGEGVLPPAPADPNARFRAAATPEENLSRTPAPRLNLESDYVPKPRPGEPIGLTVDYAKIESMIHRYPAEPTSTAPVIPPMFGPGFGGPGPMPGWGGFGPGFMSAPWPGYVGYGGWHRPLVPSCLFAPPVCYNPFGGGGISGGFFYRSKHFGIGFGF